MKTLLFLFLILLPFNLFAQDGDDELFEDEADETELVEDAYPEDDYAQRQEPVKVECVCPPTDSTNQMQEEEYVERAPANSVYFLAPQPMPIESVQSEQAPDKPNKMPGYLDKLPQGFDDSSYKPIEGNY